MNSKFDILILLFWIFLIFLFLNEYFYKNNSSVNENFNNTKIKIYNFNTTWCAHSLKFQPIWNLFSNSLNESDNIIAHDVKCDNRMNQKLIERYYVEGYPTVIIDYGNKFIKYSGPRTINGLRLVLNLPLLKEPETNEKTQLKCGARINTRPPKAINFDETNELSEIIYNFNTSWCGYSTKFQQTWDEFAEINKNTDIQIIDVKCDDPINENLCDKYSVEGYPTVLKVKDNIITPYTGPRTLEGLQKFIGKL